MILRLRRINLGSTGTNAASTYTVKLDKRRGKLLKEIFPLFSSEVEEIRPWGEGLVPEGFYRRSISAGLRNMAGEKNDSAPGGSWKRGRKRKTAYAKLSYFRRLS